jgi:IS5 family transposase
VAQSFTDFEVIAINDGATDNSGEILHEYARRDPRVKVTEVPNGGISRARNLGLELSSGELILFVDSDDRLEPTTLAQCVQAMDNAEIGAVLFGGTTFVDGVTETDSGQFQYQRPPESHGVAMSGPQFFDISIQQGRYIVCPWSAMFRRSTIGDLRFKVGIHHEDDLFMTKFLLQQPPVSVVGLCEALYQRRVRPNSVMTAKSKRYYIERSNSYLCIVEELGAVPRTPGSRLYKFRQIRFKNACFLLNIAYDGKMPVREKARLLRFVVRNPVVLGDPRCVVGIVCPEITRMVWRLKQGRSGALRAGNSMG